MKAAGLRDGGDLGTTAGGYMKRIGPAWSENNAAFNATEPGFVKRAARAINPVTGFGSALGHVYDAGKKNDRVAGVMAGASALPLFGAPSAALLSAKVLGKGMSAGATGEYNSPQPAKFRDGGDLRTGHGGHVPGSGKGDKIPAKYEPGEFVVSNDMLDKAPGLREELHGLRNQALADKGMTADEADAKALRGGGLRAVEGFEEEKPKRTAFPTNVPERSIYENLGKSMPAAPAAPAAPATPPLPGAEQDRRAIGQAWDVAKDVSDTVGRTTRDAALLPLRAAVGAYDSTVVRGMRAAGLNASYLSPKLVPDGVDPSSMAPWTDQKNLQQRAELGKFPQASYSNEGNNYPNTPAGNALTQGRNAAPSPMTPSLRGTDMGGGMRRIDGGSSPLFTNMPDDGLEGNNNLMNRRPMSAQNQGALDNMQARQDAGDAARLQTFQYNQEVAQAQAANAAQAERTAQAQLQSMNGRKPNRKERESLRQDATTRRNQDMSREDSRLDREGRADVARMERESSQATSLRAAAISERTFQTGRSDRAQDQEGKVFERAQTARKNFTERANTMFPGKDGKPDAGKVAAYTSFVSREVAGRAQKMMQSKDPAIRAAGDRLARGDMSVLDAADFELIDQGFQRDQRTVDRSGRSTAPGSSNVVGRADGPFQRKLKLADDSIVPESDITGAGWLDRGDQYLVPEQLRMR
jgi:hypothetical protein